MPDPTHPNPARRVIVLGSVGSIGTQTLDVVDHLNDLHARGEHPRRYEVVGLATGRRADGLRAQQARHPGATTALAEGGPGDADLVGPDAAERLVRTVDAELVVAGIVGIAGLGSTVAAVELGRDVALANKETLVAAGPLVTGLARRTGARLLPLDSEHAAVWQCLRGADGAEAPCPVPPLEATASAPVGGLRGVERVILTASGGPFRTWAPARIENATRAEALAHPTWSMGAKVTVDCATLLNKGFELMEARWLFDCPPDRLGVLVHPQSIVHSLVEFADRGVVAQLAPPDMRGPIQHAVAYPDRAPGRIAPLDLASAGRLDFENPDTERFPLLALAFEAMARGGVAGAVLNGASEIAVARFLADDDARFGTIAPAVAEAFGRLAPAGAIPSEPTLAEVLEADAAARRVAAEVLGAPLG